MEIKIVIPDSPATISELHLQSTIYLKSLQDTIEVLRDEAIKFSKAKDSKMEDFIREELLEKIRDVCKKNGVKFPYTDRFSIEPFSK